jgi:hypothetical protein
MAKEFCRSCEARLTEEVAFCPVCATPTRYATDAQRLEWDLNPWRAHVGRSSVAAGANPSSRMITPPAPDRTVLAPDEDLPRIIVRPKLVPSAPPVVGVRSVAAPAPLAVVRPVPAPVEERRRRLRLPRLNVPNRRRIEIDLVQAPPEPDADHEFAYRACATCHKADWILRGSRNSDETWNYWCVRCSRSFKTELRLRHAIKPFIAAAIPLGGIIVASLLLLH